MMNSCDFGDSSSSVIMLLTFVVFEVNVLTAIEWITVQFGAENHFAIKKNPYNSGDPLQNK